MRCGCGKEEDDRDRGLENLDLEVLDTLDTLEL